MKKYTLAIKNGNLVIPKIGVIKADLAIRGERIAVIADEVENGSTEEVIDASGKYVFPGLVEPHCHIGTWYPFWDDMVTETESAVAGGITTVISQFRLKYVVEQDLPFKTIFPTILNTIEGKSFCDISFHFQVPSLEHIKEMEDCYFDYGIQSFKFFLIKRRDKISPGVDYGLLWYAMKCVSEMDPKPLICVHCEVPEIIEILTPLVKAEGGQGLEAYHATRPGFVEAMAITDVLWLAKNTGAPVHIAHVTTCEGVQQLRQLIGECHVTAETQLHYLVLNNQMGGTLAKVNPPIRRPEDVEAVWKGIKTGLITVVGTDHGSKDRQSKSGDIWQAARGFPGMEVWLPLMITHGTRRGLTLQQIAELVSYNNAMTFGLTPRKGTLQVGCDADLTIVDMEQSKTIRAQELHGASDFSPYEGMEAFGWPVVTLLRGNVVYEGGKVNPNRLGKFLPRYPRYEQKRGVTTREFVRASEDDI